MTMNNGLTRVDNTRALTANTLRQKQKARKVNSNMTYQYTLALSGILWLFLTVSNSWAGHTHLGIEYWQCTTNDAENKTWVHESSYQVTAINEAFAACKKESAYPKSCKASKRSCEHFINGRTTRPMWRCVALDGMAGRWPSNLYDIRDDAALAAKDYCKANSPVPGSCYINLITCENINNPNTVGQ